MAAMALNLLFVFVCATAQDPSQGILGVEWKYKGSTGSDGTCPWAAHVKYHVTDFDNDVNEKSTFLLYFYQGAFDKTRVCCSTEKSAKDCTPAYAEQLGCNSDKEKVSTLVQSVNKPTDSNIAEGTFTSSSSFCNFESDTTYTFCACGAFVSATGSKFGPQISNQLGNSVNATTPVQFTPGTTKITSCSIAVVSQEGQAAKTSVSLSIASETKDGDSPAPALIDLGAEMSANSIVMSSTDISGSTCDVLELTTTLSDSSFAKDGDGKYFLNTTVEGTLEYAVLSDPKEASPFDQPDACKAAWSKATKAQLKLRKGAMQIFPDQMYTFAEVEECTLSWIHNQDTTPAPSTGGSGSSTSKCMEACPKLSKMSEITDQMELCKTMREVMKCLASESTCADLKSQMEQSDATKTVLQMCPEDQDAGSGTSGSGAGSGASGSATTFGPDVADEASKSSQVFTILSIAVMALLMA